MIYFIKFFFYENYKIFVLKCFFNVINLLVMNKINIMIKIIQIFLSSINVII